MSYLVFLCEVHKLFLWLHGLSTIKALVVSGHLFNKFFFPGTAIIEQQLSFSVSRCYRLKYHFMYFLPCYKYGMWPCVAPANRPRTPRLCNQLLWVHCYKKKRIWLTDFVFSFTSPLSKIKMFSFLRLPFNCGSFVSYFESTLLSRSTVNLIPTQCSVVSERALSVLLGGRLFELRKSSLGEHTHQWWEPLAWPFPPLPSLSPSTNMLTTNTPVHTAAPSNQLLSPACPPYSHNSTSHFSLHICMQDENLRHPNETNWPASTYSCVFKS